MAVEGLFARRIGLHEVAAVHDVLEHWAVLVGERQAKWRAMGGIEVGKTSLLLNNLERAVKHIRWNVRGPLAKEKEVFVCQDLYGKLMSVGVTFCEETDLCISWIASHPENIRLGDEERRGRNAGAILVQAVAQSAFEREEIKTISILPLDGLYDFWNRKLGFADRGIDCYLIRAKIEGLAKRVFENHVSTPLLLPEICSGEVGAAAGGAGGGVSALEWSGVPKRALEEEGGEAKKRRIGD